MRHHRATDPTPTFRPPEFKDGGEEEFEMLPEETPPAEEIHATFSDAKNISGTEEGQTPPDSGTHITNPFGRRSTDTEPVDSSETGGRRHEAWWVREAELAAAGLELRFSRRAQDRPHRSGDASEPPSEDPFTHPDYEDSSS